MFLSQYQNIFIFVTPSTELSCVSLQIFAFQVLHDWFLPHLLLSNPTLGANIPNGKESLTFQMIVYEKDSKHHISSARSSGTPTHLQTATHQPPNRTKWTPPSSSTYRPTPTSFPSSSPCTKHASSRLHTS